MNVFTLLLKPAGAQTVSVTDGTSCRSCQLGYCSAVRTSR